MNEKSFAENIQRKHSIEQLIFSKSGEDIILGIHILLKEEDKFINDFFMTYGKLSSRVKLYGVTDPAEPLFYDIRISKLVTEEIISAYQRTDHNLFSPVILLVNHSQLPYLGLRSVGYVRYMYKNNVTPRIILI